MEKQLNNPIYNAEIKLSQIEGKRHIETSGNIGVQIELLGDVAATLGIEGGLSPYVVTNLFRMAFTSHAKDLLEELKERLGRELDKEDVLINNILDKNLVLNKDYEMKELDIAHIGFLNEAINETKRVDEDSPDETVEDSPQEENRVDISIIQTDNLEVIANCISELLAKIMLSCPEQAGRFLTDIVGLTFASMYEMNGDFAKCEAIYKSYCEEYEKDMKDIAKAKENGDEENQSDDTDEA